MLKAIAALLIFLAASSVASAQTVTDTAEIASRLRFWSQDAGEPVYYGEVRNVDSRSMKPLGHYQCLAIAFVKHENGVFSYIHKMWPKTADGSCHYEDVIAKKVGNHGICVKDSEAGFGRAIGTARMTKTNIDWQHSIPRTVDTAARRVGETAACVPPKGVGAGLYSIKIEDGRLKIVTTFPLDYEVNIDPQDPQHPPTQSVF